MYTDVSEFDHDDEQNQTVAFNFYLLPKLKQGLGKDLLKHSIRHLIKK